MQGQVLRITICNVTKTTIITTKIQPSKIHERDLVAAKNSYRTGTGLRKYLYVPFDRGASDAIQISLLF